MRFANEKNGGIINMKEIFYYELMENDLAGKWIPIFKVGKVANRMVNGEQRNITKEELEQIYSNFKNKVLKNEKKKTYILLTNNLNNNINIMSEKRKLSISAGFKV